MIFTKNGYSADELKEIEELHESFVAKTKELAEIFGKLREYSPEGDFGICAEYPTNDSLVTAFEHAHNTLNRWMSDELNIVSSEEYDRNYLHGDDGLLDAFYDRDIIEKRKEY